MQVIAALGNYAVSQVERRSVLGAQVAMTSERPSEDADLLVLLLKVSSTINRPMKDALAEPTGLGLNELRVLMCLGGEGEMAGHDLADVMGMQPMNVSRALATLTSLGWIEQVRDTRNRRRKPHCLTNAGKSAFADMFPLVESISRFLFAGLNAKDKKSLSTALEKLSDRIGQWDSASAPSTEAMNSER